MVLDAGERSVCEESPPRGCACEAWGGPCESVTTLRPLWNHAWTSARTTCLLRLEAHSTLSTQASASNARKKLSWRASSQLTAYRNWGVLNDTHSPALQKSLPSLPRADPASSEGCPHPDGSGYWNNSNSPPLGCLVPLLRSYLPPW